MKQQAKTTKQKVLIAEDNLLNCKLVCEILNNNEIDYDVAENGKIALDLYLSRKYDLILMDIQMPIMNGIECTKKIREFEQKSKISSPIPIVAVTAFASENDKKNCFNAGMTYFLPKPFKSVNLIEVVSKFIEVNEFHNSAY